jgi:predicted RNase H-like HicB family nuclease
MNLKNKEARDYLKKPYTRILIPDPEGLGYTSQILEFQGCISQGESVAEAYANLEGAAEAWIEAALSLAQNIPEPFDTEGYGGKIALRLPRSLHLQAALMAECDGVSLNQFLVAAIAEKVGAKKFEQPNKLTVDAAAINPRVAGSRMAKQPAIPKTSQVKTR